MEYLCDKAHSQNLHYMAQVNNYTIKRSVDSVYCVDILYSTVQYKTLQYSTVLYSTVINDEDSLIWLLIIIFIFDSYLFF